MSEQVETSEEKTQKYIFAGTAILFMAIVCGAVYYNAHVKPLVEEHTSELKVVKAVVVESGKSVQIGSEPDVSAGFTLDGKVGFIAGSRPVSEEVYKVVIKMPITKPDGSNLISIRGADGSYVQVSYVVHEEKIPLSSKQWWVVKDIKRLESISN